MSLAATEAGVNWQRVRAEFPAVADRVFLNTATYGQLPRRASEAAMAHFHRRDEHACADFLSWFDDMDALRASIGRWIGSPASDIGFITSASHGLATVLNGIDWREGDEIVTFENEFPNQVYAVESQYGVRGIVCGMNEIAQKVSDRTRLALLSTVNYQTGLRPNLETLIPLLRERGILVYLDGTQSVGALEMDCAALQPEFLAVDAYKWMISPNGAGFLYVRPDVREWLQPSVIGWRSDKGWRSVEELHEGALRFAASTERYEGGMLAFPSLYAMQASLSLFEELGAATVEDRILFLADAVRRRFVAIGAEEYPAAPGALPSQIVLVRLPDADSSMLAKRLAEQKISISARRGWLRVSPHIYNNESDIAALVDAVRSLVD